MMINYTAMPMDPRPFRRYPALVLILMTLLSACVTAPSGPASTAASESTPAAREATPSAARPAGATPSPTPTPQPVSRITVDPQALNGIELQFWHPFEGATAGSVQALVERFNAENEWGIRVAAEAAGTADDLDARVETALESGDPPALAAAYAHQALAWDARHPLAELDNYALDPDWGFPAGARAGFYPQFWEQDANANGRFGLPALRSAVTLYYNQSWARELGFDQPPATPDSFREQACAAARALRQDEDAENDGAGGYMISLDYAAVLGWISAFGGEVTAPDGGYRFDTRETRAALTFLRELYDEGCAFLVEGRSLETDFAHRQGLFSTGSLTAIPFQEEAFRRAENNDDWAPLAFPSPGGTPAVTAYGPSYVIFTGPPEQELAAFLFVRWMLDAQQQAELAQASSSFPLSEDAAALLRAGSAGSPAWRAGLDLLPAATAEPSPASWGLVRWALQDAYTQLYRSYFSAAQVPELTGFLDETAAELAQ